MKSFTLAAPRGFSLAAAAGFYQGFTPGSGLAVVDSARLVLAFLLDGSFAPVGVALEQHGDAVRGRVGGAGDVDVDVAARQVVRMLGLDQDGGAWLALGAREPALGAVQHEFPGFFTAAKPSPYDAAVWGVLSPRMSMAQAARVKRSMAEAYGARVRVDELSCAVFPAPTRLLDAEHPGVSAVKMARLHGVARAALDGRLDADRLRALPVRDALAELEQLPGVGRWTAAHIVYRGAALVDALPTEEPRAVIGAQRAYHLPRLDVAGFVALGERWRPFRMWACVLFARHLAALGGWKLSPEAASTRGAR